MRTFPPKATKALIIAEYRTLERQCVDLQQQLDKYVSPSKTAGSADESDISAVAEALKGLQGSIRNAVGGYQNAVANELLKLRELNEELAQELVGLKSLHEIELNGGSTLGLLVQRYDEVVQRSHRQQKQAQQEAETANIARLDAWNEEQQQRNRVKMQQEEDWNTQAAREAEEYKYTRARVESSDKDEDEQAQKAFEAEVAKFKSRFEKKWETREQELEDRETTYEKLVDEAKTLQVRIEKGLKAATAEGENIAKRNMSQLSRITSTEHKAELDQREIELRSLKHDSTRNEGTIHQLQEQLDNITKDNQTLSQGALNSANSGARQALEVAERIAMEQARGAGKK